MCFAKYWFHNGFVIVGYSTMHPVDGSEYDLLYVVKTDSKVAKKILEKQDNWTNMFAVFGGLADLTESEVSQKPEHVKALD